MKLIKRRGGGPKKARGGAQKDAAYTLYKRDSTLELGTLKVKRILGLAKITTLYRDWVRSLN